MREIRMSGLMRGEAAFLVPLLLYRRIYVSARIITTFYTSILNFRELGFGLWANAAKRLAME